MKFVERSFDLDPLVAAGMEWLFEGPSSLGFMVVYMRVVDV